MGSLPDERPEDLDIDPSEVEIVGVVKDDVGGLIVADGLNG